MRFFRFSPIFFILFTSLLLSLNKGDEFQVNIFSSYDQSHPAIAKNKQGDFIITWDSEKQDGDITGVYARIYNNSGIPKGNEFQVNSITDHFQLNPSVAATKQGEFIIAWISYRCSQGGNIAARRFDSSGNPLGPEFLVNTFLDGYQGEPDIAVDGQGNFIIVWQSWEQDGDGFGIFGRKYTADNNPLAMEFQVNTTAADDQLHPAVAMDESGNCVVVWTSYGQDNALAGIYAQRISPSGIFLGPEFQINETSLGYRDWPDTIMDQWGNFVVCWQDIRFTQENYDIFARMLDINGIPKGSEILINTNTEDRQIFPSAAADPQGYFIVTWQSFQPDGDRFGIYAQTFDLNGAPYGPERLIKLSTAGSQEFPAAAMDSMENFIITWQSFDPIDSDTDIFACINQTTSNERQLPKKNDRPFHFPSKK